MDLNAVFNVANQVSRNTIAVIDALAARGAFKGEELMTIGSLRDQCVQLIQHAETFQQEQALVEPVAPKK